MKKIKHAFDFCKNENIALQMQIKELGNEVNVLQKKYSQLKTEKQKIEQALKDMQIEIDGKSIEIKDILERNARLEGIISGLEADILKFKKTLSKIIECPITREFPKDPVVCSDGYTYERKQIQQWFETHNTSPMTRTEMDNIYLTNIIVKQIISEFFKEGKEPDH